MLEHMDGSNRIRVVVVVWKLRNVRYDIRNMLVRLPPITLAVDVYPPVPVNIAGPEVEEDCTFWITVLHASACVLGEYEFRT
jgi:hypothetical protein